MKSRDSHQNGSFKLPPQAIEVHIEDIERLSQGFKDDPSAPPVLRHLFLSETSFPRVDQLIDAGQFQSRSERSIGDYRLR